MRHTGYLSAAAISLLLIAGCGQEKQTGVDSTAADTTAVAGQQAVEDEAPGQPADSVSAQDRNDEYTHEIDGAQRLKNAYPQKIKDISGNTIYFTDGTTMVYDDGKEKDFVSMLDNSDPQDMFLHEYDTSATTPAYLHDVGRSRSEQLFKKLYGQSQTEVRNQLVSVPWFGGNVMFSSSNNAAEQLGKVQKELSQHPELNKYLKSSGTFYWRNVRGANRLSAHSYGIAIDIGVDNSDYWLWNNKGANETKEIAYKNRMPLEIVKIFEKYGFIWGGRWYHYDTMHFEYRPELNPPK